MITRLKYTYIDGTVVKQYFFAKNYCGADMQENVQEVNDETTVRSELKKILLSLSYDTEPPRKRRKLEPDEKLLLRCKKLVRQLDGECGEVESVVVTETVLPKIKSVINGGLQLMCETNGYAIC